MKNGIIIVVSMFVVGSLVGSFWLYLSPNLYYEQSVSNCMTPDEAGDHIKNMVWVPEGEYFMGSNLSYQEEAPKHRVHLTGFWIDKYEVTNNQFSKFVDESGYVTTAENKSSGGAAVFSQEKSWRYVREANWRQPEGVGSSIKNKGNYPVVQVSYDDAKAYAAWLGNELPTEAQFEFVAQFNKPIDPLVHTANTWQGHFPIINTGDDGYLAASPVGCYEANSIGVYDMIGNVWEWTGDWYAPKHQADIQKNPKGPSPLKSFDPRQPEVPSRVIKGGSYLCAENYCQRYRAAARQPQESGLGTNHIGFRTVRVAD